jgi:hypothetical protein
VSPAASQFPANKQAITGRIDRHLLLILSLPRRFLALCER